MTDDRSSLSNVELDGRSARPLSRYSRVSELSIASPTENDTKLLTVEQIPSWDNDNEYILRYYRPVTGSYRRCMRSVFAIHNQTVNIHSHLIGALLFFILPIWTFTDFFTAYPSTTAIDYGVFSTFYFGVAICFLLSTIFHVFKNHSAPVAQIGLQLDLLGIVVLMWGAMIPTVYYGFHDKVMLRNIYWIIVCVLGTACCVATLWSRFQSTAWRPVRAAMYSSLGASAIVFIVHNIVLRGWDQANRMMSIDWIIGVGACNLTGAVMYGMGVPERLKPGRFDVWGSSHQILHIAVVLAGLAHMIGLLRAYRYFHEDLEAGRGIS